MGGLAVDEGRVGGDADGAVGRALAFEQLAGVVGDFGDFERGMEAEGDDIEVCGGGKADLGRGGEVVRRGVELSVDDVARDVERRPGDLGGGGEGGGVARAAAQEGRRDASRSGFGWRITQVFGESLHSIAHGLACSSPVIGFLVNLRLLSRARPQARTLAPDRLHRPLRTTMSATRSMAPESGPVGGQLAPGAPREPLQAPFSWTPERGRRVAEG